jgi:hypothetical protein
VFESGHAVGDSRHQPCLTPGAHSGLDLVEMKSWLGFIKYILKYNHE